MKDSSISTSPISGVQSSAPLTIVVLGASGDLARKKVLPALFALYCQDLLPETFHVIGFARRPMTDDAFRAHVMENLTCRYVPDHSCGDYMDRFLARCSYVAGEYDSRDAYLDLYQAMRLVEGSAQANRMYYMAIPPFLFLGVAKALGDAGLVECGPAPAWSRAVVEKPFGRDRESSDHLVACMGSVFSEDQTFRIDHYLGKELVQNLLVLRFANRVFDPIWNRQHVASVHISWKEDIGTGGRAGYFDEYGIIRDVVQNHLMQILALTAMEPPKSLDAQDVRNEKVRVLESIAPVTRDRLVLGQYVSGRYQELEHPAYADEPGVSAGSITPTYAAAVLHVANDRWQDVPFYIVAGKGLNERATEIRLRFKPAVSVGLQKDGDSLPPNELIIRIQPDESIRLSITNKAPGFDMRLVPRELDLRYQSAFDVKIPDAYECLLLDVIRGDRSLFVRWDELAAAWDIFTPVLHEVEAARISPEPYPFGSQGPESAHALARRFHLE
ncbi:MAG TPA: glucose-6-phosphate dehydrogenase [Candidatus Hydrogenedentes bacterium]|nr:glucose-6-phosphate dehydrogenase [Candidatus Hydrogenedentota bacterium]HRT19777.1 glucose-6-phosphate dehydrogenase [Candidatus Hydrogenedentota bacterium]HRT64551.1 glucose-6-phosphate dehydrogenase [Candidatus Hydrogenedentota bacterium]